MATPPSTIFRREALEYRLTTQGQRPATMTWPGMMARPVRLACWLLVTLLGLGGALACLPAVPVSARAPAIVTAQSTNRGEPLVAVLLPGKDLLRVRPGTGATLEFGPDAAHGTIAAVEPAPLTPTRAAQRLGLPASALSSLPGPVALVWITPDPGSTSIAPGAAGQATLPVGSRRAGSFLPLVGRLF